MGLFLELVTDCGASTRAFRCIKGRMYFLVLFITGCIPRPEAVCKVTVYICVNRGAARTGQSGCSGCQQGQVAGHSLAGPQPGEEGKSYTVFTAGWFKSPAMLCQSGPQAHAVQSLKDNTEWWGTQGLNSHGFVLTQFCPLGVQVRKGWGLLVGPIVKEEAVLLDLGPSCLTEL